MALRGQITCDRDGASGNSTTVRAIFPAGCVAGDVAAFIVGDNTGSGTLSAATAGANDWLTDAEVHGPYYSGVVLGAYVLIKELDATDVANGGVDMTWSTSGRPECAGQVASGGAGTWQAPVVVNPGVANPITGASTTTVGDDSDVITLCATWVNGAAYGVTDFGTGFTTDVNQGEANGSGANPGAAAGHLTTPVAAGSVVGGESVDGGNATRMIEVLIELDPAAGGGTVTGSADVSVGGVTIAAAGTRTVLGTAAITPGGVTLSATGQRTVVGAAAVAVGGVSIAAAGVDNVVGSAAVDPGAVTITATGHVHRYGTAAVDVGAVDITATGQRAVAGSAQLDVGAVTIAATGNRTVTGSAQLDVGAVTIEASATGHKVGTAAVTVGGVTIAGTGVRRVTGTASITAGAVSIVAAGVGKVPGTAALTFGAVTVAGAGRRAVSGTAALQLGAVVITASGFVPTSTLPPARRTVTAAADSRLVTATATDRTVTALSDPATQEAAP